MAKAKDSTVPEFAFELVVTESFPGYSKGDIVTDATKISELIDSEWSGHFVKKQKDQDLAKEEPAAS